MKPGGIILTYIDWKHWKEFPFNVAILFYQLTLLIVGVAYGKFPELENKRMTGWWKIIYGTVAIFWLVYAIVFFWMGYLIVGIVAFWMVYSTLWALGGASWRQVWRAATACHVRLCLGDWYSIPTQTFRYISFTAPEAKLESWSMRQAQGRFEYRDPTFGLTEEQIRAMNGYANAILGRPTARKYDYLALLSYVINLAIWILIPKLWGKEKIKTFNLPHGRETCSSGARAILKWIDVPIFEKYDTQMVSPPLFAIDRKWINDYN